MKFFGLIWANLWRKRLRTVLTALSIVIGFFLFGVLYGTISGFHAVIDRAGGTRLRVSSQINPAYPLPISYAARIGRLANVKAVTYFTWFSGYFQDPKNAIFANAVDMRSYLKVFPEWIILPSEEAQAFRTRNGAIVGEDLMHRYGWHLGESVPLRSRFWTKASGSDTWDFRIVATYTSRDRSVPSNLFLMHYAYLDEARVRDKGTAMQFAVTVDNREDAPPTVHAIDDMFGNSPDPTYTENESDWLRSQVHHIDNIQFIVFSVLGATLAALLVLTGVVIMQSIHERIPEIAILKACGYTARRIWGLVVAEAVLLYEAAAVLGLALATVAYPTVFKALINGQAPLPLSVYLLAFALAALLGFVSASLPAFQASRVRIADALARG